MSRRGHEGMRQGAIVIPSGTELWPHELETAKALAAAGMTVEFQRRMEGERISSADVVIRGVLWEMKAPISSSSDSLSRRMRLATKQSPNIIIDASRAERTTDQAFEKELRKALSRVSGVKRLMLVKKSREVIDIKPYRQVLCA